MDRNRPFTDCGSHTFHASRTHVANRKYPGEAGFEHLRGPGERPRERRLRLRGRKDIRAREDEALVVESDTISKPLGARRRPRHNEHVPDRMDGSFTRGLVDPRHTLQMSVTLQANNFRFVVKLDAGILRDALN